MQQSYFWVIYWNELKIYIHRKLYVNVYVNPTLNLPKAGKWTNYGILLSNKEQVSISTQHE